MADWLLKYKKGSWLYDQLPFKQKIIKINDEDLSH